MLAAGTGNNGELTEADQWLAEIGLAQYRPLFRKKGECLIVTHLFDNMLLLYLGYSKNEYNSD